MMVSEKEEMRSRKVIFKFDGEKKTCGSIVSDSLEKYRQHHSKIINLHMDEKCSMN